jgi:hypothetical protein
MEFKEFAISAAIILFPVAWLVSAAVGAWDSYKRQKQEMERLYANTKKDTALFGAVHDAIQALAKQKSLIVLRNDDGSMEVRALSTAGQDEVKRVFQDEEEKRRKRRSSKLCGRGERKNKEDVPGNGLGG